MRITLPDDLTDVYERMADAQGRTLDQVLTDQLRRFSKLAPGQKAIVINADALKGLEDKLGGLPLRNGDDLLARVQQLAGINFMGINIGLSPGQLAELQHRAERQGRSVEALVHDIWRDLSGNFFYASGGGPAAVPAAKAV